MNYLKIYASQAYTGFCEYFIRTCLSVMVVLENLKRGLMHKSTRKQLKKKSFLPKRPNIHNKKDIVLIFCIFNRSRENGQEIEGCWSKRNWYILMHKATRKQLKKRNISEQNGRIYIINKHIFFIFNRYREDGKGSKGCGSSSDWYN